MELNEGLKKIFLAGVGAVATTAETAKDVVDNLVKKGELTMEQGKVLNEELKQSAKEKVKEHVSVTVVKEYKDAMSAVDHMTAEELEALKAKIAEAETVRAQKCEEPKEEADDKAEECTCGCGCTDESAAEETPDTCQCSQEEAPDAVSESEEASQEEASNPCDAADVDSNTCNEDAPL